jgi:hypothetical protein
VKNSQQLHQFRSPPKSDGVSLWHFDGGLDGGVDWALRLREDFLNTMRLVDYSQF